MTQVMTQPGTAESFDLDAEHVALRSLPIEALRRSAWMKTRSNGGTPVALSASSDWVAGPTTISTVSPQPARSMLVRASRWPTESAESPPSRLPKNLSQPGGRNCGPHLRTHRLALRSPYVISNFGLASCRRRPHPVSHRLRSAPEASRNRSRRQAHTPADRRRHSRQPVVHEHDRRGRRRAVALHRRVRRRVEARQHRHRAARRLGCGAQLPCACDQAARRSVSLRALRPARLAAIPRSAAREDHLREPDRGSRPTAAAARRREGHAGGPFDGQPARVRLPQRASRSGGGTRARGPDTTRHGQWNR